MAIEDILTYCAELPEFPCNGCVPTDADFKKYVLCYLANLTFGLSGGFQAGFFGNGSDGDVVISADTDLTRDMYYDNLTIDPTFTLNPNGYRIFVRGTLINNGIISTQAGAGGAGGAGGAAGTAGAGYSAGYYPATTPANPGGAGGVAAGSAALGTSVNYIGRASGNGGAGGAGSGGAGGAGGSLTGTGQITYFTLLPDGNIQPPTPLGMASSPGGGGGGGDGTAGGGGGGGGAHGGVIFIAAPSIINAGAISANGGAGGAGGTPAAGNRGGGGGGAGGAGGLIYMIYGSLVNGGTTTVTPGAAGAAGVASGTGVNGVVGTVGTVGDIVKYNVVTRAFE